MHADTQNTVVVNTGTRIYDATFADTCADLHDSATADNGARFQRSPSTHERGWV